MAQWEITTANSVLEFDTQLSVWNSCHILDENHFVNFWTTTADPGKVQVFTINTSTWAVTTAGAVLTFNANYGLYNSCEQVDANHFINFFRGTGQLGSAQTFAVNTSTFAVTTANAILAIDSGSHSYNSCCQIDTNHFIDFWQGNPNAGQAQGNVQVFTVNTSTWAVTTANSFLVFAATVNTGRWNSCSKIDANHFINFWQGNSEDGFCQVFTVSTSTWAVTTASSTLEFETQDNQHNNCFQIDDNHFVNFWAGVGDNGFCQVFTVNTTTWAVTTANSSLEYDTDYGLWSDCYQVDSNHFINFWSGNSEDGFAQVFTINTSTWAITTSAASLEFDTQRAFYNSCYKIDTNHFVNFWSDTDTDGKVQVFAVEGAAAGPANLKTLNTNAKSNIKTVNTSLIANVKSYNTIT